MKKNLSMSDDGSYKFQLLPELLPFGYEDKAQMIVGVRTDEKGEKVTERIEVWREETSVFFEKNRAWFYNPIISEAEPVDMENAKSGHPGPFTLSATGRAREMWSGCWGDYTLTKEEHNDRPVYKKGGWYLYSTKSGAWAVDQYVDDDYAPWYGSTDQAPSPALCQNWEYGDRKDGKFKPGDIKVEVAI